VSATRDLARAIMGPPDAASTDPNCRLSYGTVTQVSPLLVKVGAATVGQPCSKVSGYTPVLADYVMVLVNGADRVALGSMARNSGAPAGTGTNGDEYWDTAAQRLYRSDGTGWIVMAEPGQTFAPTVTAGAGTITAFGGQSFSYKRSDGWLDYWFNVIITTNGTGASSVNFTLPKAVVSGDNAIGFGRESSVTGAMLQVIAGGPGALIVTYANAYPAGNGYTLNVKGRYQMSTRYL